jgi:hypothetical protein
MLLSRQKLPRKIDKVKFRSVSVENMKTDNFIIYITTTHPTALSWICQIYKHLRTAGKFFQECYLLIHNALSGIQYRSLNNSKNGFL